MEIRVNKGKSVNKGTPVDFHNMSTKEQNRQSMRRREENIVSIYFDMKRGVPDVSTEVHTSWVYARTCVSARIQLT